ncbi:hypothetical protein QQ008_24540 [Fulvivirgaceae bacterium BMA10]|uniref:RES domain-containing protein n=1 Tax=Splendidivirga corallicola TaxID=3051826 RepID=A0ABT8KW11_9BACT|nr:hypothetical protein [Fulvivirgaceae bacterium BMA10]
MNFLEILKSDITNLPIERSNDSFKNALEKRLEIFNQAVQDSKYLSGPVNGSAFHPKPFKRRSAQIVNGITRTIEAYYEGNPHQAFTNLSKFMRESNLKGYLKKDHNIPEGTNFYRIRLKNSNFPLGRKELFHIPYDKRGIVGTQRYSIPGLPSLYLSNAIYVAWEELGRPGFDQIQAARIVNTQNLTLLDLKADIYNVNHHLEDNHIYGWQLLYAVMVWPLVAACSVKVKNRNDSFKPEYIIPQLLLQWINKNDLDGIKYSSTHINFKNNSHQGHFYNLVIPTKSFKNEAGHCENLKNKFKMTEILPMQLRQFMSQSDHLHGQESIRTNVNPDIRNLELIKGNLEPYSSTSFGVLEHSLNYLSLNDIE